MTTIEEERETQIGGICDTFDCNNDFTPRIESERSLKIYVAFCMVYDIWCTLFDHLINSFMYLCNIIGSI